jgi:hypothetical protein
MRMLSRGMTIGGGGVHRAWPPGRARKALRPTLHPASNILYPLFETWFSILQGQSLSGASFTAVTQLQEHIDVFVRAYNDKAAPFVWIKKKVRQRRFKDRRITQL